MSNKKSAKPALSAKPAKKPQPKAKVFSSKGTKLGKSCSGDSCK